MESSFDDLAAEFMASDKLANARIRWLLALNTDTAKAQFIVTVPSRPAFSVKVHMAAHVHREPLKYSFSLLLGSHRVLGLDVNPGRSHVNFTDLGKVCAHRVIATRRSD